VTIYANVQLIFSCVNFFTCPTNADNSYKIFKLLKSF
jgi:hypothetical protein